MQHKGASQSKMVYACEAYQCHGSKIPVEVFQLSTSSNIHIIQMSTFFIKFSGDEVVFS